MTPITARLDHRDGRTTWCAATYKPHHQHLIVTVPDGDSEAYLYAPWHQALLAATRHAWPGRTPARCMPARLGKVFGDFAGTVRDFEDAVDGLLGDIDVEWDDDFAPDAARELGNLLLTAARYLDDLGIALPDAIAAATAAQHADRTRTEETHDRR